LQAKPGSPGQAGITTEHPSHEAKQEIDMKNTRRAFIRQTGMALLTFFHNFLSMILFFKALKFLDAMQVALSNYLITFFGLPIAAIWLGESLNNQAIAGGILVLVSTLIITIVDYRLNREALTRPVSRHIIQVMNPNKKEI